MGEGIASRPGKEYIVRMRARLTPVWMGGLLLIVAIVFGHLSLLKLNQSPPGAVQRIPEDGNPSQAALEPAAQSEVPAVTSGRETESLTSLQPSPGLLAVLRMIQACVGEGTLLAFVTNSQL